MRNLERSAFTGLVSLILGPIIAQGVWRPLVHFLGPIGSAGDVTAAALVVAGVVVSARTLFPARSVLLPAVCGALVAAGATFALTLGLPGLLSLLLVAVSLGALAVWLPPQLPDGLDGLAPRHKVLTSLYVLFALLTLVSTTRVSIFMGDSTRMEMQVIPGDTFIGTHSCLSAYAHAIALSHQHVDNLYAVDRWQNPDGSPLPTGVDRPYAPFVLDYFAYPPPFLLAMLPVAVLEGDFAAQRALWFGLNGLFFAVGLWAVARWVGGPQAHRLLLLSPLFMGSLPVLAAAQVGNFQASVVMLAVLGMVALEKDRPALGGAMLAFAILSKLSPGVLGIALLAQRRWRDALWTAGFGVIFLVASVLAFGVNPLVSFLTYTFPRLNSGEAFAFMDDAPFSIWTNLAPFGWPFKLQLIGLEVGDPWVLGRIFGRIFTVALLILVVLATRRQEERHQRALSWMAVLVLSALQSPFAPGYVLIGLLWATVILSVEVQRMRHSIYIVLLWLGCTIIPPLSMSGKTAYSLFTSCLVLGTTTWLIVRGRAKQALKA